MALQTIQEFNVTTLDGLFIYVMTISPVFVPIMLFSIFMVVALGTFFSQQRLTGRGDFAASFATAGWFVTIISAGILSLVSNLVNVTTLVVCVSVSIIGTIILLYSDRTWLNLFLIIYFYQNV